MPSSTKGTNGHGPREGHKETSNISTEDRGLLPCAVPWKRSPRPAACCLPPSAPLDLALLLFAQATAASRSLTLSGLAEERCCRSPCPSPILCPAVDSRITESINKPGEEKETTVPALLRPCLWVGACWTC